LNPHSFPTRRSSDLKVLAFRGGDFLDPIGQSLQKVPNDLGDHLEGLWGGLPFIDPKEGNTVADPRIAGNGTDFPACKTVGRKILGTAHFTGAYGTKVQADNVATAQYRFGQFQIGGDLP